MKRLGRYLASPVVLAAAALTVVASPVSGATPPTTVDVAQPASLVASLSPGGALYETIEDLRRTNDLPLGDGTLAFGSPRRLVQIDPGRASDPLWRKAGSVSDSEALADGLWLVPVLVNGAPVNMAMAHADGEFGGVGGFDNSLREAVLESSSESYVVAANFVGNFVVDEQGVFRPADATARESLTKFGPRAWRDGGVLAAADFRALTADVMAEVQANQPPANPADPVVGGRGSESGASGSGWSTRQVLVAGVTTLVVVGLFGIGVVRRRRER